MMCKPPNSDTTLFSYSSFKNSQNYILIGAILGLVTANLIVESLPSKYVATAIIDLMPFKTESTTIFTEPTSELIETIKIEGNEKLDNITGDNNKAILKDGLTSLSFYKSQKFAKIIAQAEDEAEATKHLKVLTDYLIRRSMSSSEKRIENIYKILDKNIFKFPGIDLSKSINTFDKQNSKELMLEMLKPQIVSVHIENKSPKNEIKKYIFIGTLIGAVLGLLTQKLKRILLN